ncbi:MAG: serine hydrolase domain-containing protein [Pyrinomonadaceae bacterium]
MKRLLTFSALIVTTCLACVAQASVQDEVDRYVQSQMKKRVIPGLQLVVVRDGSVIKRKAYGVANVELNVPVTNETVFEIASNSKQFTAGAIMLLDQDGRLRLDYGITKYLSGLPKTYDEITIRHLLDHTSGVKDYIEEFQLNRSLNYTSTELIERIGANELNFRPGDNARYSTTGYVLLGLIIEQITGKGYGEFLRTRIFEPLGMKQTRAIDLSEIIPNRASGYRLVQGNLVNGRYVAQTLRASADIGLSTTASDQAKWDAALGSNKIFTQASLNAMFAPAKLKNGKFAFNDWNGHFGLGWFIDDYYGHRLINHGGTFITGFHAEISRFVDKKLTVIILTNRVLSDPASISWAVAGHYNSELLPPYRMVAAKDRNPERSERLKAFLVNTVAGRFDANSITSGFRERLNESQKFDIAEFIKYERSFSFIGCRDIEKLGVERFGSKIKNICHYKVSGSSKNYFVSFYLSETEKTADLVILSDVD